MMIQAVLGNPHHPEYGVATIPFPIPRDQYAHCMELLEALEIGDAIKVDCKVEEVDSFFSVLKRTEMLTVNRGQPVCNHDNCFASHQFLESLLQLVFIFRICSCRSLIHNDDIRIL